MTDAGPAARLAVLGAKRRAALAVLAGLAAGLGQVPFALPWLALPGFALAAALAADAATAGRAFRYGWITGTTYFALTLHWIVEPFFVDPVRHGWMAPFAVVFLSGGLALFWGAAGALAWRILRGSVLAWAVVLALAEMLRGHVLTGFPWALPGYVWTETDVLQAVAWIGPYGLTFATLLAAAGLAGLARQARHVPAAALVLAALALSYAPILPEPTGQGGDRPVIRLVQPNAPQREKWDPEKVNLFFSRQIGFTREDAGDTPPALVVWPETAIPWSLERAQDALAYVAEAGAGVPVILGANRREGGRVMNALAVVGTGGEVTQLYDKHHLVPFGEYVPLQGVADALGLGSMTGGSFTPGPGPAILDLFGIGAALPLICYEAIFPGLARGPSSRPDLLLQITNDAWFGEFAGPQQHFAQARSRAVEQGLPMVRVANTGISAMIDGRGRVLAHIPLGHAGYLDAPLPPPRAATVYSRFGDSPVLIAILVLLGGLAARARKFV